MTIAPPGLSTLTNSRRNALIVSVESRCWRTSKLNTTSKEPSAIHRRSPDWLSLNSQLPAVCQQLTGYVQHAGGNIDTDNAAEVPREPTGQSADTATKVEGRVSTRSYSESVSLSQYVSHSSFAASEELLHVPTAVPVFRLCQDGEQGVDRAPVLPSLTVRSRGHSFRISP